MTTSNNLVPSTTSGDTPTNIDFLDYWRSITKRKWGIIGLGLSIAIVAGIITSVMTPIYKATALLMIEENKNKVISIEDVYAVSSSKREYFQTLIEVMQSREVAMKTIQRLKLWNYPVFDPRNKDKGIKQKILETIGIGTSKETKWDEDRLAAAVYGKFRSSLSVEPVKNSFLVIIHFESPDNNLAALVANTVSETFIRNDLDTRYQVTRQASNWLQENLASVKDKLEHSEKNLQTYRDQHGIVNIQSAAQSGLGQQISEYTSRLADSRMRRAEAETAYNQIKNAGPGADLSSLPSVSKHPSVLDAKKQLSDADRKLNELSQRYGPEHPKLVQTKAELHSAQDNFKRQLDNVVLTVTREYEAARSTENTLEKSLGGARAMIQNINRKEYQLGALEREVDSNRQLYEMFLKRAKETNISLENQSPVARVIDSALTPSTPAKPRKTLIISLALLGGIFLGALASLLIDRLDNTLKTSDDAEAKLHQPILTTLPVLPKDASDRVTSSHIFLEKPDSVYAESIRTARSGVLLSAIDKPNRILLVTSSLPGEGKTTFSINLALAHAHTAKTLLLECDMRRPTIARSMDLEPGASGLSDLVAGTSTLKECLHSVNGSTLSVIPAGTIPPNPLELLISNRFKETIEALAKHFEIIVIDSPPVELVSDAQVVAPYATGTIFVVKAAETPFKLAAKAINRIKRGGGEILGVVLNQLDFQKAHKYYGEYSGYSHYGYKGGYSTTYGGEARAETT
jgi:polysaccharide biosynthesis transport protein